MIARLKDLDRLEYLYAKMSKKQRAMAEPYPYFKIAPFTSTDEINKRN
jgi:hypothetical protein